MNHIKFRFTGPEGDVDAAMKYIKDTFLAVCLVVSSNILSLHNFQGLDREDRKRITPFDTVAVDPRNIKIVFLEVKNVIFEEKVKF